MFSVSFKFENNFSGTLKHISYQSLYLQRDMSFYPDLNNIDSNKYSLVPQNQIQNTHGLFYSKISLIKTFVLTHIYQ